MNSCVLTVVPPLHYSQRILNTFSDTHTLEMEISSVKTLEKQAKQASKNVEATEKKKRGLGYLVTFSSSLTLLSKDWKDCFQMILIG